MYESSFTMEQIEDVINDIIEELTGCHYDDPIDSIDIIYHHLNFVLNLIRNS